MFVITFVVPVVDLRGKTRALAPEEGVNNTLSHESRKLWPEYASRCLKQKRLPVSGTLPVIDASAKEDFLGPFLTLFDDPSKVKAAEMDSGDYLSVLPETLCEV